MLYALFNLNKNQSVNITIYGFGYSSNKSLVLAKKLCKTKMSCFYTLC